MTRAGDFIVKAILGALGGILLAALGNAVTSSAVGIGLCLLIGTGVGATCDRLPGAIVGLLLAGMFCALGSVMGGSPLGVGMTIGLCMGVALMWVEPADPGNDRPDDTPSSNSQAA